MDKSILQEYLNLQFIPLDDDSALEKLKKASAEIAKKLQKDKSKIISYTLVALDPQIPVEDSTLISDLSSNIDLSSSWIQLIFYSQSIFHAVQDIINSFKYQCVMKTLVRMQDSAVRTEKISIRILRNYK